MHPRYRDSERFWKILEGRGVLFAAALLQEPEEGSTYK